MKYSITHCYTDKNKGDAAIIIATVQLIRSADREAEIHLFSTYGCNDARFRTDHNIIKRYADRLHPSFFSEPVIPLGRRLQFLRLIPFLWNFLKSAYLLISPKLYLSSFILKKEEARAFEEYLSSDVIFSKGGSYLYAENDSIRSSLSLVRMLYPFVLAARYNKKMIIFSQSLGPVVGRFNNWLFRQVLLKVDHIYLRESLCIDRYESVRSICDRKGRRVIPDTAFYLHDDDSSDAHELLPIDRTVFNVGFTIVNNDYKYIKEKSELAAKKESYKNCIIDSIRFLVDRHSAAIHIFPQVLVDMSHEGHNDLTLSQEIKASFAGTKYDKHINIYTMDLSPVQLRNLYGEMGIFIGTRLHSVIFALSVSVPSINIAYHGTKAQGILTQLGGMDRYVVDINTITSDELIGKIQDLYQNKEMIKAELADKVANLRVSLENAMKEILST